MSKRITDFCLTIAVIVCCGFRHQFGAGSNSTINDIIHIVDKNKQTTVLQSNTPGKFELIGSEALCK